MMCSRPCLTSAYGYSQSAPAFCLPPPLQIVDVPLEQAKQMVVIQPGLLFDTQREATTLAAGIKSICYELKVRAAVHSLLLPGVHYLGAIGCSAAHGCGSSGINPSHGLWTMCPAVRSALHSITLPFF
jgi:hypothetical protein